jgi:hypothetical protein
MAKDEGKLWHILSLLPPEDWDKLRLFLQSPYFNRSLAVQKMADCYHEAWSAQRSMPEDEAVFSKVYPGESFEKVKMKNLRAALQRKVDDFLAQAAFDRDPLLQAEMQLQKLNQLADNHFFQRYHERATHLATQAPVEESQRQLALYAYADLLEIALVRQPDRGQREMYGSDAYHHAWQFFQVLTLRHLISKANTDAIVGQADSIDKAEAVLPLMLDETAATIPIQLHTFLLQVYRHPEEKVHFEQLLQALSAHASTLGVGDAFYLYTGAINHCIRRINLGDGTLLTTLIGLYKQMDTANLLLTNGKLSTAQFKNMVALALRCQEVAWAESIIARYGKQLENDPNGTAEAFNQGLLCYSKGDFAGAERSFHKVLGQFEDIFYGLDARSILLRVYYETNNAVGMESLAESFKMYVKRNKHIAKAHKDSYLTTAKFFKKLIQIPPFDRPALLQFQSELQTAAFASSSKQWLLAKVAQLLAPSD